MPAMGLDFLAHQKDKGKNWPSLIFRSTLFSPTGYSTLFCIYDNIFRMTLDMVFD